MGENTPTPTILIVDDDEGVLHLIEKLLRREGFATATAASGKEAIAWLDQHQADLMLLDLKLPDMRGQALVEHLEGNNRSVPFIVITGQGDERVAVEMMKMGAVDYLVKEGEFLELVPVVVERGIKRMTERKRLEKEILEISEREQQRIGRDLHDGLGQHLTGIELMTQALEQQLATESKSGAAHAAEIARYVREAINQTRLLAKGLSPVALESEGLMCALKDLSASTEKLFKVACSFRCDVPVLIHDNATTVHLYRIAQEAVSNAIKHGKAKRIEIGLTHTEKRINLAVHDNGIGFPKMPGKKGMGLRIMRYRVGVIGGSLAIQKKAGGGTTVVCSVHQTQNEEN